MPRLAWHNAQMLILVEMNTMQMTAKEHRTVIAALPSERGIVPRCKIAPRGREGLRAFCSPPNLSGRDSQGRQVKHHPPTNWKRRRCSLSAVRVSCWLEIVLCACGYEMCHASIS